MSEIYEIIKNIGGGSFGQVYLARHKREEKQYVIKKIKTRDMSQKDRENTENEVKLLQKLRHSNIVAYKDSYLDREQYLNIVMVYCEGGDIYQRIKSNKGKNFPEDQILDWMAQMALALYYLHDKKILHRDLKTQNIFLKNGRVRLGDFGIAKTLDSTKDFANTCIGTPYYMSPELFKYKPYSYKSDIWAFGCCVYEMCNLRHAFDAQSLNGLAVKIMNGSFAPISNTYSKQLKDLIGKMISINPKNRPTVWDIMNKKIVKNRIIAYMQELFHDSQDMNKIQDVDDVYLDSLKEQGEKLGILPTLQKQIGLKNDPTKFQKGSSGQDNDKEAEEQLRKRKLELLKEKREKKRMEEELKKLEKIKQAQELRLQRQKEQQQIQERINNRKSLQQQASSQTRINKSKERQNFQQNNQSSQSSNSRSYSYERKRESSLQNKNNNQRKSSKDVRKSFGQNPIPHHSNSNSNINAYKQNNSKPSSRIQSSNKYKKNQNQNDHQQQQQESIQKSEWDANSSQTTNNTNYKDQCQEEKNKRDKILKQKELKQQEEQELWKKQFNQIQVENAQNRQKAAQQKAAQYRPSTGMRDAIGQDDIQQINEQMEKQHISPQQQQYLQKKNGDYDYEIEKEEREIEEVKAQIQQEIQEIDQVKQEIQENDIEQRELLEQKQHQINSQQDIQDDQKYENPEDDFDEYKGEENEDEEEEQNTINEVDEDNYDEQAEEEKNQKNVANKIEQMRTQIMQKTMKINELQQSLKPHQKGDGKIIRDKEGYIIQESMEEKISEDSQLENTDDEIDDDIEKGENSDYEDYKEDDGQLPAEAKLDYNPQYQKINDRIRLLKHRCEAGLGNVIYEKTYEYLKQSGNQKVDQVRKKLLDILGDDMIGFWHLIDQILMLEGILAEVPQRLQPEQI